MNDELKRNIYMGGGLNRSNKENTLDLQLFSSVSNPYTFTLDGNYSVNSVIDEDRVVLWSIDLNLAMGDRVDYYMASYTVDTPYDAFIVKYIISSKTLEFDYVSQTDRSNNIYAKVTINEASPSIIEFDGTIKRDMGFCMAQLTTGNITIPDFTGHIMIKLHIECY